jgi:helix-turn-helix protein
MVNPQLKASDLFRLLSNNPKLAKQLLIVASPWLLPDEAAAYLKVSSAWLAQRRFHDLPPRPHSDGGKVRYHRDELDEYAFACDKKRKPTGPKAGRPSNEEIARRKAARS